MTQKAFCKALGRALKNIKRKERTDYINHYKELISDLMENGMSEEEAIRSLGNVKDIADDIMQNMDEGKLVKRDKILIAFIILDVLLLVANVFPHYILPVLFIGPGEGMAYSVIGGADGPTSVFVAGRLGTSINALTVFTVAAIALTILYVVVKRHKKQEDRKKKEREMILKKKSKRKKIILGVVIVVIAALLSLWFLTRPEALGNMNHTYKEPTTSISDFSFAAEAGDRIKFSFASEVESGELDMILYDSAGNVVYELDKAGKLETFYTLDYADTYTMTADYTDFAGKFKIKIYKVD